MNFSATQEIDRIQQAEKTKLAAAEEKITNLENTVASQQVSIAFLQSTLDSVLSRLSALENSN